MKIFHRSLGGMKDSRQGGEASKREQVTTARREGGRRKKAIKIVSDTESRKETEI